MPQGKKTGRTSCASMWRAISSDMDWCHWFGQTSNSMKTSLGHLYNLDPKQEEQMKTKRLPLVFLFNAIVYLSVDFSNYFIMEKFLSKLLTDLFFFSQQNLLHFYFHIKTIHFHFHIEFISNSVFESTKQKFKEIQLFFSYRQIKDISFPHTLMYDKNEIVAHFLTEKKKRFSLLNWILSEWKIHRTREKFHWETSLCHCATFHTVICWHWRKEFSSHFHRGQISLPDAHFQVTFVFLTETNFIVATHKRSSFHRTKIRVSTKYRFHFQFPLDFTSTNKGRKAHHRVLHCIWLNSIFSDKKISLKREFLCNNMKFILLQKSHNGQNSSSSSFLFSTKKNYLLSKTNSLIFRHTMWTLSINFSWRKRWIKCFFFNLISKTIQWSPKVNDIKC